MQRLYFDTAALVSLARSPRRRELIERLTSRYETQVSVFNVAELSQAKDQTLRKTQLEVAARLCRGFKPLGRTRTILIRSLEALADRRTEMNWSLDDNLDGGIWVAMNDPESVGEAERQEIAQWLQHLEVEWRNMHVPARRAFNRLLARQDDATARRLGHSYAFAIRSLFEGSFLTGLVSDLIRRTPTARGLKVREDDVITKLEPWRFLLGAIAVGIYEGALRRRGDGHTSPGSVDTQQAIYLAATDIFVTPDYAMRRMLRLVNVLGHRKRIVWPMEMLTDDLAGR